MSQGGHLQPAFLFGHVRAIYGSFAVSLTKQGSPTGTVLRWSHERAGRGRELPRCGQDYPGRRLLFPAKACLLLRS
jgi:hypothetical protein